MPLDTACRSLAVSVCVCFWGRREPGPPQLSRGRKKVCLSFFGPAAGRLRISPRALIAARGHHMRKTGPIPRACHRWCSAWPGSTNFGGSLLPAHPAPRAARCFSLDARAQYSAVTMPDPIKIRDPMSKSCVEGMH